MIIDLTHNKIVKDTISQSFINAVTEKLIPELSAIYGARLLGVQMYEDYIKDNLSQSGFWYYPMTVILPDSHETVWIKWDITRAADFRDGVPYAFVGEELKLIIAEDTPEEFCAKLSGRSTYYEGGHIKLNIHTNAPDPTFLSGRFSQTFIDELARQMTKVISRACAVEGLACSSIELSMVFAPDTYMEHTSENTTYRRLLMSAKGCTPRDFWIRWTRSDSSVAYSVKDTPAEGSITFELGEDVPHKIREKEYRFLVYGNSDKYRNAMGRKNITEWREIIKRAVKRGELTKTAMEISPDADAEYNDRLSDILAKCGISAVAQKPEIPTEEKPASPEFSRAMEIAMAVAGVAEGQSSDINDVAEDNANDFTEIPLCDGFIESRDKGNPFAAILESEPIPEEAEITESIISSLQPEEGMGAESKNDGIDDFLSSLEITVNESEEETVETIAESEIADETEAAEESEIADEPEAVAESEIADEPENIDEPVTLEKAESPFARYENLYEDKEEPVASAAESTVISGISQAEREALEAKIEDLTKMAQELEEKNTMLIDALRQSETLRQEQEAELRRQLDLEAKERAREKLLFAEAAKAAREENERVARERDALEAKRAEEEAARAAEEEQRRLEAERASEIARIEASIAERAAIQKNDMERVQAMRARIEEQARIRAGIVAPVAEPSPTVVEEPSPAVTAADSAPAAVISEPAPSVKVTASEPVADPVPVFSPASPRYTYTSKLLRIQFRNKVDPNVTSVIHRLMSEALEKNYKSHVYMKVKATIPEENVVLLNFVKFPQEEMELLVAIINHLGEAKIGITKIILE